MNKIEEMIKQLCPNGVEWKKLGEICTIVRGIRVVKSQLKSEGKYPVFQNSLAPMGYFDEYNRNSGTYLISAGAAGDIGFCKTEFWSADDCLTFLDSKVFIEKYLYYFLKTKQPYLYSNVRKASIPRLSKDVVANLSIPLPTLPIQTEIVRILDKFVEQQEQLERLIELKKKQYEYYREELLKPKEGEVWETKRLGEIGTFVRGNGLQKTDFREEGFPCIHYGQVHTYYGFSATETKSFCSETLAEKLKKASYGDLIIATTSEDVDACCKATVWLGKGKVAISGDSYLFSHNKNPKFVAHLFRTKRFADQKRMVATGAKVVRVSGESMAKFEFQIPSSLDRQKEIADALDRFELSLSSLISALEATKARYEYYRDFMLNF